MNILITMKCYIDTGDTLSLQQYFNEKILPASTVITSQNFVIDKLAFIKIPELKSILYAKLVLAMQYNLNLSLELTEEIDTIYIDSMELCNILGILLDNAIEASFASSEKQLRIAFISKNSCLFIHIENSTYPINNPLDLLYQQGYTSKGETHSGLGLYQLRLILEEIPNICHHTHCKNGCFIQLLEIFPNS